MSPAVSVAELLSLGVQFDPHEAVALVLELISHLEHQDGQTLTPVVAPAAGTVRLGSDATVLCDGCAGTPTVAEIGALLDSMLPAEGRVPGALRYAIARARGEVDAPLFMSLEEFASALKRFEKGRRDEVLGALYARSSVAQRKPRPSESPAAQIAQVERRRNMPTATELRKRLREADRELYEMQVMRAEPVVSAVHFTDLAIRPEAPPAIAPPPRSSMLRQVAAVAGAVALGASFFAGYTLYSPERRIPSAVGSTGTVSSGLPGDDVRGQDPAPPPAAAASAAVEERTLTGAALTRGVPGPAFSPSFTRDGTTLLYHTGRSDDARSALISQQVPEGSRVSILNDGARNYHVQESPDGMRIAFDSDRDGKRGVYVADRNGDNARRVTGSEYAAVPTWAPEGRRLTFVRAEDGNAQVWNLWMLSLASGEVRRLTDLDAGQPSGASWFPDGQRICYSLEDRLMVVDVDHGRWRRYRSPIAGSPVRTPAVSPDGTQVIFQVSQSGAWLLDLETGSMRQVLDDSSAEDFAWSPDGRRVAFHSRRTGESDIWIMPSS